MPVNANALIEADDLPEEERTLLGIPTITTDLLETKINEASDWIERETRKFFIQRAIEDEEYFLTKPKDKIFLRQRPAVSVESITDPSGTEMDLTQISLEKEVGLIWGNFWQTLGSNSLPAPWLISYTAGMYADRDAVAPALQNACKQVIAWRWRVTANIERGDMVPLLIKEALTDFYAGYAL